MEIYADFNNVDEDGFVRLNTVGTIRDLSEQGIVLSDGLEVVLSDGELCANGVVALPGAEGVWRVRVTWPEVRS